VTVLSNGEEPQPTWAAHAMTPGTEVVLVVAWRTGVHTPPPVTVTSPFAGGGSVSTMLRSSLPSGPGQVVQAFPGATVERLVIEHAAAVRWLREEGFALRRVDPADLLALHAASVEVLAERVRAHSWSTAFELWWRTALRRSRDVGSVVGRPGVVEQLRAAQASST